MAISSSFAAGLGLEHVSTGSGVGVSGVVSREISSPSNVGMVSWRAVDVLIGVSVSSVGLSCERMARPAADQVRWVMLMSCFRSEIPSRMACCFFSASGGGRGSHGYGFTNFANRGWSFFFARALKRGASSAVLSQILRMMSRRRRVARCSSGLGTPPITSARASLEQSAPTVSWSIIDSREKRARREESIASASWADLRHSEGSPASRPRAVANHSRAWWTVDCRSASVPVACSRSSLKAPWFLYARYKTKGSDDAEAVFRPWT